MTNFFANTESWSWKVRNDAKVLPTPKKIINLRLFSHPARIKGGG